MVGVCVFCILALCVLRSAEWNEHPADADTSPCLGPRAFDEHGMPKKATWGPPQRGRVVGARSDGLVLERSTAV